MSASVKDQTTKEPRARRKPANRPPKKKPARKQTTTTRCQKRPSCREFQRRRVRLPSPPKERDVAIFHLTHDHHWTQDRIAAKYNIKQPTVCQNLKRVDAYFAAFGVPRRDRDLPLTDQLRLAMELELSHLLRLQEEAQQLSEVAREPYQARQIVVQQGDQVLETRTITQLDPPRVGWTNAQRSLATRIGALRQALAASHAEGLTPPKEALYSACLSAPVFDKQLCERWDAMDEEARTCAHKGTKDQVASLDERVTYWRYHALGIKRGMNELERDELATVLSEVDRLAIMAAAMTEAAPRREQSAEVGGPLSAAAADRRQYLELLLSADLQRKPDICQRILQHYDAEKGTFCWEEPAEDLRWLIVDLGITDGIGKGNAESQTTTGDSEAPIPQVDVAGSSPEISTDVRELALHIVQDRHLVVLLEEYGPCCGRTLADMPNDQQSVVIFEEVEELVRDDEAEAAAGEDSPRQWKPGPRTGKAPELTDELKQKIYRDVGEEGVAVLARDGKVYQGSSLAACGLVQNGILFLRARSHSTPPWGESHWKNFVPRQREQKAEVREQG